MRGDSITKDFSPNAEHLELSQEKTHVEHVLVSTQRQTYLRRNVSLAKLPTVKYHSWSVLPSLTEKCSQSYAYYMCSLTWIAVILVTLRPLVLKQHWTWVAQMQVLAIKYMNKWLTCGSVDLGLELVLYLLHCLRMDYCALEDLPGTCLRRCSLPAVSAMTSRI